MKKIFIIAILSFILILSGCIFNDRSLYATAVRYQMKLNEILEDGQNEDLSFDHASLYKAQLDQTDFDPDKMVPIEDFMAVYNNQRDNVNDVQLDVYLRAYKNLLDGVIIELETLEVNGTTAHIESGNIDIFVSVTSDDGLLIKFVGAFFSLYIDAAVKLGYDGDDFYIRRFLEPDDKAFYTYFEFLENNYVVDIRYQDNKNFRYLYVDQDDQTYYEIYESDDYSGNQSTYLRWFNAETNIRTSITSGDDELNHFEVFNDKGLVFKYSDKINEGNVWLYFQLLEASGWDYAYLNDSLHSPHNGVYRNGEPVFTGARQFNVDLHYLANVSVSFEVPKEEITDELLNLSMFGLDFNHPEITIAYIETIMNNAFEASKHLSIYRGIDFLDDSRRESMYEQIDADLKRSS